MRVPASLIVLSVLLTIGCTSYEEDIVNSSYRLTSFSYINCSGSSNGSELLFSNNECDTLNQVVFCTTGAVFFDANNIFSGILQLFTLREGTIDQVIFSFNSGSYSINGSTLTMCTGNCIDFEINDDKLVGFPEGSNTCDIRMELTRQD